MKICHPLRVHNSHDGSQSPEGLVAVNKKAPWPPTALYHTELQDAGTGSCAQGQVVSMVTEVQGVASLAPRPSGGVAWLASPSPPTAGKLTRNNRVWHRMQMPHCN